MNGRVTIVLIIRKSLYALFKLLLLSFYDRILICFNLFLHIEGARVLSLAFIFWTLNQHMTYLFCFDISVSFSSSYHYITTRDKKRKQKPRIELNYKLSKDWGFMSWMVTLWLLVRLVIFYELTFSLSFLKFSTPR